MRPTPTWRWLTLATAVALACATLGSAAPRTASATDPPGTLTSKVLIKGAPIHGGNGLAIDQDGRLLVASVWGREIVALDPATGKILERIGPEVDGALVEGPDDVAVGPDGSICWTDLGAGSVKCLRPDGSVDDQFVAQGVNPIAFNAEGRLFVALAFFGDKLYELDPDLVDPPKLLMSGSGIPPWPDQLNGFDFAPDGRLWSPRPFSGQIGWIDVDAASPTFHPVASGVLAGSVEFSPAGSLYASLALAGEIVRVDTATGMLSHVAWLGPDLDNMVFDARGRLYVSNSHDGRIVRVLPSGRVRQLSRPGVILPGGIAAVGGGVGGADRLFIADVWSLAEYDGRTGRPMSIDQNSLLGGSITTPWTVAPDGGHLIVTSWMANLVEIWDPVTDTEVAAWPDFAVPVNAIRFGDDLVVAELGTGSVVRQTPGGTRTTVASGLYVPSGLAATDDDLWAADWATGIVWRIVTDGAPSMVPVKTGLANPEGLAVDHDGSLLVVESGAGRLTRILPTGETVVIADGLALGVPAPPDTPPAYAFNGVAVGPSGAIYVTGDRASVVWRFDEVPN
jgi:sugar lactone lactonase YvrE